MLQNCASPTGCACSDFADTQDVMKEGSRAPARGAEGAFEVVMHEPSALELAALLDVQKCGPRVPTKCKARPRLTAAVRTSDPECQRRGALRPSLPD